MMKIEENKWYYYNLDLIEESLQNDQIPVILIAGASSSGKSHYAKKMAEFLKTQNKKVCLLSTDNYNRGVSEIVFNKVNKNYFDCSIPDNQEIISIIRNITINKPFADKFDLDSQQQIQKQCKKFLGNEINKFTQALKIEFDKINFDEQSVYNLDILANDINNISSNKEIVRKKYSKVISEQQISTEKISNADVVIVEGLYALNENLIKNIKTNTIKNFIECDSKSLFLRRILRDKTITNCPSTFIIKNYLEYVVPSYNNFILPSKNNANFVIDNNMTFEELRHGEIISVQKKVEIPVKNIKQFLSNVKILKCETIKDTYLGDKENILRLREIADARNNFKMVSLTHKGYAKYRFDKKLIRPVNTLLTKNELQEIFTNQTDFLEQCSKIGLEPSCTEIKKRFLVNYKNCLYHLDYCNDKFVLEIDESLNTKIVDKQKQCDKLDIEEQNIM